VLSQLWSLYKNFNLIFKRLQFFPITISFVLLYITTYSQLTDGGEESYCQQQPPPPVVLLPTAATAAATSSSAVALSSHSSNNLQ
jgi:hypothetical protein